VVDNVWVRAVAVCPGCDTRIEYDATISADLDHESDSYGSTTTRAVVDFSAPDGWYAERGFSRARFWCSFQCAKDHPHVR